MADERRAQALLAAGAAAGLALAAAGLIRPEGGGGLPAGAVATVNGAPIRIEEYQRALAALAADRRNPVGDAEQRYVLDRLVDEELLVQRGLELGLARRDRRVRSDLVAAVIEAAISGALEQEPTPAQLEAFYREQADYFARSGRLRLSQVWVRAGTSRPGDEARARAAEAARRLRAGEPFAAVVAELGDPELAPLPEAPLPAAKLREYLGPTAVRTALDLEPGEVSDPVRSASGFHVLVLVERAAPRVPALAEIADEVRAELRRRADDRALRAYLDDLRQRADVRVDDDLP